MLFTPHIQSILFSQHFSDHVLTVTKTILNWHKSRSIEQIKRPERNPHIWSINLWQGFPGGSSGKEVCQRRRQEMQVWSQGWEDSQEDSMATHSTVHAWGTPWTEEPGRLQSTESQRGGHNWSDLAHNLQQRRQEYTHEDRTDSSINTVGKSGQSHGRKGT